MLYVTGIKCDLNQRGRYEVPASESDDENELPVKERQFDDIINIVLIHYHIVQLPTDMML